jgi:adenosylcobinamide-phosphate synthase
MLTTNFLNNPLYCVIPLIAGFILDSIFGDPLWLPHPVRLFGKTIYFSEKNFNSGNYKKLKGILTVTVLTGLTFIILFLIENIIANKQWIYYSFASIMFFYGIANKNLISEALKVEKKLSDEGIEAGRKQLSFIVGRDTSKLSKNEIRIAILETLSENLSDGIIAPVFYYAIGGIPLMFTYKMINTLDSMIAYKNEKYKRFGWFAAKLDDFVNFIPARITSILMVIITFNWKGLIYIFKFGNKHSSPNAGYPEAALAGILNCRFGGSHIYHGKMVQKPYIGINERLITKKDVIKTCIINYITSFIFMAIICFIVFVIKI